MLQENFFVTLRCLVYNKDSDSKFLVYTIAPSLNSDASYQYCPNYAKNYNNGHSYTTFNKHCTIALEGNKLYERVKVIASNLYFPCINAIATILCHWQNATRKFGGIHQDVYILDDTTKIYTFVMY